MTGMQREVPCIGTPRTGQALEMVHALVEDGPIPPEVMARCLEPDAAARRAEVAARVLREDWADQGRYERDNAAIVASGWRPEIVFMGDSITEIWPHADPQLFRDGRVCRGIAGQTTPQMLLRFHADVIDLRPHALHLMGGGNDIVGNTGPTTLQRYQHNVLAMTALAGLHGIRVILGGIAPSKYSRHGSDRLAWVIAVNDWLRDLARERSFTFVDYFTPLRDADGGMRAGLANDEVHPNRRGYVAMRAALERVL